MFMLTLSLVKFSLSLMLLLMVAPARPTESPFSNLNLPLPKPKNAGHGYTYSYCNICPDHTMCIYYAPGASCRDLTPRPLGQDDQNEVVAAHNTVRWTLAIGEEQRGSPGPQPPAANMRLMWYDDELAAVAQRWAEQCRFKHDTCRDIDRFQVGQNIYWEGSSKPLKRPNWDLVTRKWYDEVAKYSGRTTLRPFSFSAVTGHFTQLSWADTFLVGCGISEYTDYRSGRRWFARLYVCNYGPAGNVVGDRMYSAGNACTQCPENSYCYYGLCV